MPDCENCNERCPKAEMAHEIALGRMYTTNELVNLVKKKKFMTELLII